MMDVAITTALVAGGVALSTAVGTIWSSIRNAERTVKNAREIEKLRIDNELQAEKKEQHRRVSKFSEPLARAAYDLQSRLFNIIHLRFLEIFLAGGSDRERLYAVNNTAFLVAQYACWTELMRREVQFTPFEDNKVARQLLHLQDDILGVWGSDSMRPGFRIFAGELRAIGEALLGKQGDEIVCIGYGAFLSDLQPGTNFLIDAVRSDVENMQQGLEDFADRIRKIQNALIDLLNLLDPDCLRFPSDRRSKA